MRANVATHDVHVKVRTGSHGAAIPADFPGMGCERPLLAMDHFEPLTKSFVEVMRKENPRGKIIWALFSGLTPTALPQPPEPFLN